MRCIQGKNQSHLNLHEVYISRMNSLLIGILGCVFNDVFKTVFKFVEDLIEIVFVENPLFFNEN